MLECCSVDVVRASKITFFVVSVDVSVASEGDSCLCGNDDWKGVRSLGFYNSPGCCGGEIGEIECDVRGGWEEECLVRDKGMLMDVV